jgi:integrase
VGKLTEKSLKAMLSRPPKRYPDGQGLYFKTIGLGRAYFTYRFMLKGGERELSVGPFPETTLDQARIKHAELRALVLKGIDPRGEKRAAKNVAMKGVPTFGVMAIDHVETHEAAWRSPKHRQQWRQTLTQFCQPIWSMPVDQVTTANVLEVLKPIWTAKSVTAGRLRGRIEVIIDAARVLGHIDADRANCARWKGHLQRLLPKPTKLTRGHHAALAYSELPAFMARLAETPGVAALALEFLILTATRTSETLNMTFDEIDFETATWTVPKERMKMQRDFSVPLSDRALDILKAQHETRGKNPHVFAGRPQRPLSSMSLNMLLRRMKVPVTVHGFRSSALSWMADTGVPFELAEAALAHQVGNAVVQAYQRSSMLERRRPIMNAWADHVTGKTGDNVVQLRKA